MARQILNEATAVGTPVNEMENVAMAYAERLRQLADQRAHLAVRHRAALRPYRGGFINGQHRAQAMLDSGVRRTVVLLEPEE